MSLLENTKILPASLQIPRIVKILAQSLQFISHRVTIWFSAKLFTTPISYPTPKREKMMFKSAQKNILEIPRIGKKINILSYGYSKKKILLAHGWDGRSTQLFMIADKLLEKGYMTISFDGLAHEKSTGKTTNMLEYIETIKAINEEFGPFEAAVGHSFGAMMLLNVASEKPIFKKLVTIGAADLISDIIKSFVKNLELKSVIASKLQHYFEKYWAIKLDDFASSIVAKKIKIRTLIVHDTSDGDVPVSCAHKIRQNLENGTLLITHGLGHTKILRDKQTMNRVANFITKN